MVITRFLPYSGLILEHAHVPMASSFAVGHSEFADSVPGLATFKWALGTLNWTLGTLNWTLGILIQQSGEELLVRLSNFILLSFIQT